MPCVTGKINIRLFIRRGLYEWTPGSYLVHICIHRVMTNFKVGMLAL